MNFHVNFFPFVVMSVAVPPYAESVASMQSVASRLRQRRDESWVRSEDMDVPSGPPQQRVPPLAFSTGPSLDGESTSPPTRRVPPTAEQPRGLWWSATSALYALRFPLSFFAAMGCGVPLVQLAQRYASFYERWEHTAQTPFFNPKEAKAPAPPASPVVGGYPVTPLWLISARDGLPRPVRSFAGAVLAAFGIPTMDSLVARQALRSDEAPDVFDLAAGGDSGAPDKIDRVTAIPFALVVPASAACVLLVASYLRLSRNDPRAPTLPGPDHTHRQSEATSSSSDSDGPVGPRVDGTLRTSPPAEEDTFDEEASDSREPPVSQEKGGINSAPIFRRTPVVAIAVAGACGFDAMCSVLDQAKKFGAQRVIVEDAPFHFVSHSATEHVASSTAQGVVVLPDGVEVVRVHDVRDYCADMRKTLGIKVVVVSSTLENGATIDGDVDLLLLRHPRDVVYAFVAGRACGDWFDTAAVHKGSLDVPDLAHLVLYHRRVRCGPDDIVS